MTFGAPSVRATANPAAVVSSGEPLNTGITLTSRCDALNFSTSSTARSPNVPLIECQNWISVAAGAGRANAQAASAAQIAGNRMGISFRLGAELYQRAAAPSEGRGEQGRFGPQGPAKKKTGEGRVSPAAAVCWAGGKT